MVRHVSAFMRPKWDVASTSHAGREGSIFDPTLFLLCVNDLQDAVIRNIAIYADDSTLYSKCDQASDLWQQLELAYELESDLQDTGARSGFLISMLGKLNWFRLICLIAQVLLDWKSMGLFLRKNNILKCWSWPSLLHWFGALTLSLLLKLHLRKLEP